MKKNGEFYVVDYSSIKRTQLAEGAPTPQIWGNLSIKKNELLDYNTLNFKIHSENYHPKREREERKLLFINECQLINAGGMMG